MGTRGEWLTAARALSLDKAFIGVSGFHFHPKHLEDVLVSITREPVSSRLITLTS